MAMGSLPAPASLKRKSPSLKRKSLSLKRKRANLDKTGRRVATPVRRRKLRDSFTALKGHCFVNSPEDVPAIVVNLDRRPDRWRECEHRLRVACPTLEFSRFDASDGSRDVISFSEVTPTWNTAKNVVYQKLRSQRKGWNDLHKYVAKTLSLSPGERGCAYSHVRAWQHCLAECNNTNMPLLVLEDDAKPTPEFNEVFSRAMAALPDDAHVLYLGYSQAAEWRRQVAPEIVEAEYVWTTVAYMVWPAGARIMLSRLPVDQPVDNWMANLCAEGHLKSYCVRPKIVLQADAWNVNSDVGHSDENYWGPDSDIHHSDHLYWGDTEEAVRSEKAKRQKTDGPHFWDVSSDEESHERSEL